MPELPEVEAVRLSLIPCLVGRKIESVFVGRPKLVASHKTKREEDPVKTQRFIDGLTGETFARLERRAKNLIFIFESGKVMNVHLRMTGQLIYRDNQQVAFGGHPIKNSLVELPSKHSHVVFELDRGTLYYNDTRMFGHLLFFDSLDELEESGILGNLGLEPLEEFSFEEFDMRMRRFKSAVKKVLLEQRAIVGLGNIYCDEVLFDCGILPTRRIDSMTELEMKALYESIRRIMPLAVEMGGSSVANYVLGDGSNGSYASQHKVYGRAGKPCMKCGSELKKTAVNQRTTVYCENCQS